MSHPSSVIGRSLHMREEGFSLGQISNRLGISKSTASLWTSKVKITQKGRVKITERWNKARAKGRLTIEKRREAILKIIEGNAKQTIKDIKIEDNLSKLLCSIFIWTEGEKGKFDHLGFANSDPRMIKTFLSLLRRSFPLDERKFRALVHIHEYHDKNSVLNFWSKITNIPLTQFTKCYLKPHTGKRKREGYMGSMHISYFDYKVARELASVYNMFASKF